MTKNPEQLEARETYEDAVKRHRQQLRGSVKGKTALKMMSRFFAAEDVRHGLVAAPA